MNNDDEENANTGNSSEPDDDTPLFQGAISGVYELLESRCDPTPQNGPTPACDNFKSNQNKKQNRNKKK